MAPQTEVATVSINVSAVNDAPTANGASVSTPEDVAVPVTLTGSDPDGDTLSFVVTSTPAHGALTGSGANRTYTPARPHRPYLEPRTLPRLGQHLASHHLVQNHILRAQTQASSSPRRA